MKPRIGIGRVARKWPILLFLILLVASAGIYSFLSLYPKPPESKQPPLNSVVKLPQPQVSGKMSVEDALAKRRSIREYTGQPLTLAELSQLLWAAQGITEPRYGFRTAPSAGATYPLEIYLVVGQDGVVGLEAGVYQYNPRSHALALIFRGDLRSELSVAAIDQRWVAEARIDIVIAAVFERTTAKYGERGVRYVYMEAGHAGQNVYLQATALGLGTVVIGAFHDEEVQRVLRMPRDHKPLYIMPVGYPK